MRRSTTKRRKRKNKSTRRRRKVGVVTVQYQYFPGWMIEMSNMTCSVLSRLKALSDGFTRAPINQICSQPLIAMVSDNIKRDHAKSEISTALETFT
ncbi:hypothetical protein PoB_001294500 [Plakobranchus ocellatus]|uniref:Uncharacterized protein n=1 Tax=Plakobranchus ocellatus TaxID=259542 RepID=A0AAV3YVG9_9GAST|nr:hypothetical protein PoB_001294500 [Plakobranchus ocellatus]